MTILVSNSHRGW